MNPALKSDVLPFALTDQSTVLKLIQDLKIITPIKETPVIEGSMNSIGACTKRVKPGVGLVNARKNFLRMDNKVDRGQVLVRKFVKVQYRILFHASEPMPDMQHYGRALPKSG